MLFVLGVPGWAFFGYGLARLSFQRLDRISPDDKRLGASPFTVSFTTSDCTVAVIDLDNLNLSRHALTQVDLLARRILECQLELAAGNPLNGVSSANGGGSRDLKRTPADKVVLDTSLRVSEGMSMV